MDTLLNTGLNNIPATKNPRVPAGLVKNPDGSISTVRTMSFTDEDGNNVLIPTVNAKGYIMEAKEAIKHYYKTGEHYGKFVTVDEANKAAEKLHNNHATLLNNPILNVGLK